MRIGVYAGSFNPVHNGHIHVVNFLLENNYVDKILLLPTPEYWDKTNLLPVEDRIEMLRYFENDKVIVDTIHNNYPYTYQVLRSLKKDYKEDELYLIIGSDNLEKFHLWEHVNEILENKVLVVKRDSNDIDKYISKFNKDSFIIVKDFNPINISSSEIRKNLNNDYLDNRVYNYIKENDLY